MSELIIINCTIFRAFSNLFGKFLVSIKLEKNSAIFSQRKVYILNWDFSAKWECFMVNWKLFQPNGKIIDTGNWTHFSIEKKVIFVVKTKVLNSCGVTVQLICIFVFV